MPKCRQLSKLPKAKSIKSVNFSRTTPGSLAFLLGWGHTGRHQRPRFVDTSHPATKLPKSAYKTFPNFRNEEIAIRAVPKALLTEAEIPWPDPPYHYGPPLSWSEQSERLRKAKEVNGVDGKVEQMKIDSVDMSMACVVGKKGVHKNATVRAKTTRRLKTAVSLVISRGAYTYVNRKGDNPNDIRLAFEDSANTDPYQWISPDWTYVFTPTLSIYRMPYPELVGILRSAFAFMLKKIKRIEAQWIGADTSVLSSVKSPPARKKDHRLTQSPIPSTNPSPPRIPRLLFPRLTPTIESNVASPSTWLPPSVETKFFPSTNASNVAAPPLWFPPPAGANESVKESVKVKESVRESIKESAKDKLFQKHKFIQLSPATRQQGKIAVRLSKRK